MSKGVFERDQGSNQFGFDDFSNFGSSNLAQSNANPAPDFNDFNDFANFSQNRQVSASANFDAFNFGTQQLNQPRGSQDKQVDNKAFDFDHF